MVASAAAVINTMLCVNAPSLAQLAVSRLQGITVDVSIYQRRRDMLCQGLSEIGYQFNVPEGAFYLFPKSPIEDDVEFTRILKKKKFKSSSTISDHKSTTEPGWRGFSRK